jgi:hypothetical protein
LNHCRPNNTNNKNTTTANNNNNRPAIIIKNKKEKNMHADRCASTSGQKYHAKGSRKETKIQEIQRMWNMKCVIIPVINGAT